MLDRHLRPLIDRSLDHSARSLAQRGVSANTLTAAGLVAGLIAALCIALGAFWLALFFALASRLLDGLDGAVARASFPTALGGYLDILADFTFYAALPVGFVLYDPALNGAAGAILLARMDRLVYGAADPKAGAVETLYRICTDGRLNHQVDIVSGVLAEPCAAVLRSFFQAQRAQGKK